MWREIDLFHLFRWMLVTVCTVYATLQLASMLWGCHQYLSPQRRVVISRASLAAGCSAKTSGP